MNSAATVLPLELWIRILIHVVEPEGSIESNDWPSYDGQRPTPLKLATISRSWRQLVLACSDMWTGLSYAILNHSVARGGLAGVQAWLARSGTRPISLEFTCHCDEPQVLNAFLEVFYPHFPRLSALHIGMWCVRGDILPIPRVDMPLCWLVHTNFSDEDYAAWFTPFFMNDLPALRALKMREYTASTSSHMPVERHISNLTHLDAVSKSFQMRPVDLLRGCPRLVNCRLYFRLGHNDNSNETSDMPFTLPHLRTLWIQLKANSSWSDVFAHATFPVLEEMTLVGSMWPIPTFAPFLKRSRCPLRDLLVLQCNISAIDAIAALSAVSETLEMFHFGASGSNGLPGFNDTLLDALDPQLQDVLVPRLRSLKIVSFSSLETTDGRFLNMVRARMTSTKTVPFEHIVLLCGSAELMKPNFHELDFDGLSMLEEQYPGLAVTLYPDALTRQQARNGPGTDHENSEEEFP